MSGSDLIEAIVSDPLGVPADASAVRHVEFGFLRDFFTQRPVHEGIEGRIEDVQDERSAIHQVPVNACEARELIFHGEQMLERPERDGHERERPAEIEPAHIGFHDAHFGLDVFWFIAQPLTTHREHVR